MARGVCIADLLTSIDPPVAGCRIAVHDASSFRALFLQRGHQSLNPRPAVVRYVP